MDVAGKSTPVGFFVLSMDSKHIAVGMRFQNLAWVSYQLLCTIVMELLAYLYTGWSYSVLECPIFCLVDVPSSLV